MKRPRLSHFVPLPKLRPFLKMPGKTLAILDVGCGSHSPSLTKHWLRTCRYYGVDRERCNNSDLDYALMDGFFGEDLETSDLSMIPDEAFDGIIMAHVIEHLGNGEEVIARLARKLRAGGKIYLEFPSERSLTLPSGVGSLNFHDDPSHVRLYSIPVVSAACGAAGLTVTKSGIRRDSAWIAIDLMSLPLQLASLVRNGKLFGPLLWDLLGFASFVIATKAEHSSP